MLIEGIIIIRVDDYAAAVPFGMSEYQDIWGKPATHIILPDGVNCDLHGLEKVPGKSIGKGNVIIGRPPENG